MIILNTLKIGVQTSPILQSFGVEKGFEMIRNAGFDCVDLNIDECLTYEKIVNNDVLGGFYDQTEAQIKAFFEPYAEAAAKYGIAFSQAHAPFPSWVSGADQTNEYLLSALEKTLMICGHIGCPRLIIHPFFASYNEMLSKQAEWELNISSYSRLIPAAQKYGVTICLENMFVSNRGKIYAAICQDPAEACRYIDTLNAMADSKCFGFCLDVGHSLLVGRDVYQVVVELGNRIEALHLHDNNGISDQHIAPYMGILDWDRLCKGLREIGYNGVLSFETCNALLTYPSELAPQTLSLISAAGRLFAKKIGE